MADDKDKRIGDGTLLGRGQDPTEAVRIITSDDEGGPALRFGADDATTVLPHWAEPPTGEVPRVFQGSGDDTGDLDAWSSLNNGPLWRDDTNGGDLTDLTDLSAETRLGALADDDDDPADLFPELDAEPSVVTPIRTRQVRVSGQGSAPTNLRRPEPGSGRRSAIDGGPGPKGTKGRNMPMAIGVGVAMLAVAVGLFKAGPRYTMALVVVVLGLAAAEFFAAMRRGGHHPASLLGILASIGLPLAAYWHGEPTLPVVLFLTVAATFCWFLFVEPDAPTVDGIGTTIAGVAYIGLLGSFAALMLTMPDRWGVAVLAGTVLCVVANDVAALFVGSSGTAKLAPSVSPNKTWEGLIGGVFFSLVVGVFIGGVGATRIHPFENWKQGLALGAVVAIASSIGDLVESKVKRDLGIKDMGSLLPGHGGLVDRFDGLLFSLPAAYYLAQLLVDTWV